MTRRSDQDAAADALYSQVPGIACKGLCSPSCGPVPMSRRERARIREETGILIPPASQMIEQNHFTCPALTDEGRCAAYAVRPMICFLPGSWIYTGTGPRRIEDVRAGDMVYGNDGHLHRVTATTSTYYEGMVVNVRHSGTHLPCWSTADHQWLTTRQADKNTAPDPQWRPAQEITPRRNSAPGDYLTYPRTFQTPGHLERIDVTDFVDGDEDEEYIKPSSSGRPVRESAQRIRRWLPVDTDFLFMLGLYLAEGSCAHQTASLAVHEEQVRMRAVAYLEAIGVTSMTVRTDRSRAVITVHSVLFGRLFKTLAGSASDSKRIHPRLFASLSAAQLWDVYRACHLAGGHKTRQEGETAVVTTSEELAVQMGFIALANGAFPRTHLTHRGAHTPALYEVRAASLPQEGARAPGRPKDMHDEHYTYMAAAGGNRHLGHERTRTYQGPVIDIQVSDAESFVTTSGIAHNCRVWGASQDLPCRWGCRPADGQPLLTTAQTYHLLGAAMDAGGGCPDHSISAAQVERLLAERGPDAFDSAAARDYIAGSEDQDYYRDATQEVPAAFVSGQVVSRYAEGARTWVERTCRPYGLPGTATLRTPPPGADGPAHR